MPAAADGPTRELIGALSSIKGAAAVVNGRLGVLAPDVARAIHDAAAEVARGRYDDQFAADVFQTGSGTSPNMTANEVIALLASRALGRPVHPDDDVNASQSPSEVFPSAVHLAATRMIKRSLLPALDHLAAALAAKAQFGGYAATVRHGGERARAVLPDVGELPLGSIGLNAPPGFAAAVIAHLAADMDLPLTEARSHFEAAGAPDALVAASGVLGTIAVSLFRICHDLRLMNAGPVGQVCAQVIGNDAAVAFGGAAGNFELAVMMPVISRNLLGSIGLLASAPRLLADRCVSGITTDGRPGSAAR
jgi:fumarate hydratase class II